MVQTFTLSLRRVDEITKGNLGLDKYPLYKGAPEGFREALNDKIKRHYWTREIGMESIELWRYHMETKMGEIMPAINQMYESAMIEFDPLATVNMSSTSNGTSEQSTDTTNESNSDSEGGSKSRVVGSEFPQTMLNASEDYATTANDSASDTKANTKATDKQAAKVAGKDQATTVTKGFSGAASELLLRYRATIINPDMMVIEELNQLFMFTYSNGDAFTY